MVRGELNGFIKFQITKKNQYLFFLVIIVSAICGIIKKIK